MNFGGEDLCGMMERVGDSGVTDALLECDEGWR